MTVLVVDLAAGESLHVGPMTVRVLEDGSHTEHRLGIVEVTVPPGIVGPPQHVHRSHDETFYIVSGKARFISGDDTIDATPGTLLTSPVGVPHTFENPGEDPVVMYCTITPDLYVNYFRELAEVVGRPDPETFAKIMAKYDTEFFIPGGPPK